jgi:uncharacterized protein
MKRKLRVPALLMAAALCAAGADFGALKPQGYVSDFAGVLDEGTKAELNAYCARVEKATGAQIALVTLPGLQGEPIEDVANLLYRKWGVGNKKTNEGVLLLLSIGDRRSRLEVGYGLEEVIPDGYAGSVLRGMRPALRERDYGGALAEAARALGERIAEKKGVEIGQAAPRGAGRRAVDGFPVGSLVVVAVLVLVMLFFGGGRSAGGGGGGGFLAGMLLGNLLSGGMRTRSGGGFGGYDSGDSFGGFGGGDSGGGGASSDW